MAAANGFKNVARDPSINILESYGVFNKKFYTDWSDTNNEFSNPIVRVQACAKMIHDLVTVNLLEIANFLYRKCSIKKVWSPNTGIQPQKTSLRVIEMTCSNMERFSVRALGVTTKCLPIAEEEEVETEEESKKG